MLVSARVNSRARQGGYVVIFVTLALALLIGFAALTVDVNHLLVKKTGLHNIADSAALAAAVVADTTDDVSDSRLAIKELLDEMQSAGDNVDFSQLTVNNLSSDSNTSTGTSGIRVDFSNDPTDFPPTSFSTALDIFVRVEIVNYQVDSYFLGIFGDVDKVANASAVAGPSTGYDEACNVSPLAVCIEPGSSQYAVNASGANEYWGYEEGKVYALKTSSPDEVGMGAGNFQLLDFGSGASTVEELLAGAYDQCIKLDSDNINDWVTTETGNTQGAMDGLNMRFGAVNTGNLKKLYDQYPVDWVISQNTNTYSYVLDEFGEIADGEVIFDGDGSWWGLDDYNSVVNSCDPDNYAGGGTGCALDAGFTESEVEKERRTIPVPMIDCANGTKDSGKASFEVEGIGCFFLVQEADESNADKRPVVGEFDEDCTAKFGKIGGDPTRAGTYDIRLYKDPVWGATVR